MRLVRRFAWAVTVRRLASEAWPSACASELQTTAVKQPDYLNSSTLQRIRKLRRTYETSGRRRILLEGKRVIRDALQAGLKLEALVCLDGYSADYFKLSDDHGTELFSVDKEQMSMLSDLVEPPGYLAIMKRPQDAQIEQSVESGQLLPLTVVCQNLRDPGNAGALLRVLAAAGCRRVLLLKGCCDVWQPKVLRGGMGAQFRLPIVADLTWTNIGRQLPDDYELFVADSDGVDASSESGAALDVLERADHWTAALDGAPHVVLLVGGETAPLAERAVEFAVDHRATRLHVPMCRGMDSLNIVTAVAIIAFEMKRQFLRHAENKS